MLRVSGFILEPINIIIEPIDIFNARATGIKDVDKYLVVDKRVMAISGVHEPTINPPL